MFDLRRCHSYTVIFWCIIVTLVANDNPCYAADAPTLSKENLLTWPYARADLFGCFLEKNAGFKHKKFNCDLTNYENKSDPCRKGRAYFEGPHLPSSKAAKLNNLFQDIGLTWEHGDLQKINIELTKKIPEGDIRKTLSLPDQPLPSNVLKVEVITNCSKRTSCVVLTGFEPAKAGGKCPRSPSQ